MAIQEIDITYTLSGGANNEDPAESLGGSPSAQTLTSDLDNLFSTLTPQQATRGKIDYRCFYIFNDNPMYSMYDFSVWVEKLNDENSHVAIGFFLQNEVQVISMTSPDVGSPPPDSGSFKINIGTLTTAAIPFTSNATEQASNIQTALREILENDIDVEHTETDGNTKTFEVSFYGINGNKTFDEIEFSNNTTVPSQTLSAERTINGSPINTIAGDIGNETTTPAFVTFNIALRPGISVGTLHPNDGFPVWLRRTIPPGLEPITGDGINIHCRVKSSPLIS